MERRRRWARGRVCQVGKRFFLDSDDGDVVAGAARRIEHKKREPAVPRDQA